MSACGTTQIPKLPSGIITPRRIGMKVITNDHLHKYEKYFWVLDPDRGSTTSNKPNFTLDEGNSMMTYKIRLERLRKDLVCTGKEALRNEITERFANDGLLLGDQPAKSFQGVERIIGSRDMKALFAKNYKMVFVLMVKNVWSCRECHNSWLYPRVRKWCNVRAQCPFDFDEYDGDSLFIDLSTSKINTLHQIVTSELKDVYDKIHKLEKDHFGVRCFSGNTKD